MLAVLMFRSIAFCALVFIANTIDACAFYQLTVLQSRNHSWLIARCVNDVGARQLRAAVKLLFLND